MKYFDEPDRFLPKEIELSHALGELLSASVNRGAIRCTHYATPEQDESVGRRKSGQHIRLGICERLGAARDGRVDKIGLDGTTQ